MNKELKVSFYLKRESRLEKNAVGENVKLPFRINIFAKTNPIA